jgi:PAS domain S-box-containing protein
MSRVETVELAELEHLGRTLDHMLDAVALLSPVRDADGHIEDFRLKYLNQAARELWGADAEREVGRPLREVAVGLVEAGLIWHCSEVLAHDAPVEIDAFEVGQPGGRHFVFALQIAPFGESVLLVGRDVTERADLDRSLRRSERQLAAAQRLAKIGWWRYDIDRARLEVSDELRVLFGYAPDDTVDTAQMQERTSPEDRARLTDLWERTIASGGSYRTELRMTRVDGSEMRAVAHAEVEEIDDDGTTPKMLWGTLQDVTDEREAQEEAQRQQDAVERLQEAIGPDELPRVAGVALSAAYLPAGIEANVGGDWYDAVALRDGRVALVVADAGGHGLPAVALMTQIRHAARTLLELGGGPGDVLKHLTNLVAAAEGFATALVAFFDPITGVFTWASAGHLPPVAHDRDDAQLLGGEPGIPLGVPTDDPYREHVIHLPVGGSVVLFTDGLVERRDEVIDAGLDRLRKSIDALVQTDDLRADELAASLVASGEHDDDVCVLVMTRA